MTLYVQPHQSQYQPGASDITRHAGCTWTTGANGTAAITGGSKRPTPDQVHALVARHEETSPATPGWSMHDLVLAMSRYGVVLVDRTGAGWAAVVEAHDSGHYLALLGDSDQFGNGSCSGAFDGPHCLGVHPKSKVENGITWWWIDDPICSTGRWERVDVLERYAEKFASSIRFGVWMTRVPNVVVPPPKPPVTLRYGARALSRPLARPVRTAKGHKANVRLAPRTTARRMDLRANGKTFITYQVTDHGQRLGRSSRWYGNRLGTRWVHASNF